MKKHHRIHVDSLEIFRICQKLSSSVSHSLNHCIQKNGKYNCRFKIQTTNVLGLEVYIRSKIFEIFEINFLIHYNLDL